MYCYKCGCELNSSNRCPNCGSDVSRYKKIIYTSNYLYNDGLEKARVKDLSGAILSLKQAIWFNKDNLKARNLLGLCYYQIGEVVAALSEWVISQNINDERLHEKNNLADSYIKQVQNSKQMVDNSNTAIRRYNHALDCCNQDNLDVAILQLKKVLTLNSHFLRARQLLALLYIQQEQWARAQKELRKCLLLDVNNTTTLRYLQEVELKLSPEQNTEESVRRRRNGQTRAPKKGVDKTNAPGVIKYRADNETIIQPIGSKTPGVDGFGFPPMLTGLILGVVAGAALVAFLVMPSRVQSVRSQSAQEVREISAQMDDKETTITDLKTQVATLQAEIAEKDAEYASAESGQMDALLETADAYIKDPNNTDGSATTAFAKVNHLNVLNNSEAFQSLYYTLKPHLTTAMLDYYYLAGSEAYEQATPDYAKTITDLESALVFDSDTSPSQAHPQMLFYLGDAYYQSYIAADHTQAAVTSEAEGADEAPSDPTADYMKKASNYLGQVARAYPDSAYADRARQVLQTIASDAALVAAAGDSYVDPLSVGGTAPAEEEKQSNQETETAPAQTVTEQPAVEITPEQQAQQTQAAQDAYEQALAGGATQEEAAQAANNVIEQ